jgi:16S rRNA (adenine1518-N6/adenine1519-N6)-dimethyltransferase
MMIKESPRIATQNILKKYKAKPQKKFGQNFLENRKSVSRFAEAVDINKDDVILEIGPGMGILTEKLSQKAKKVIAIEKDPLMVKILKETLTGLRNVDVIQADARKIDPKKLGLDAMEYKLVGNLPFYLTSRLIRIFLESKTGPKEMIFLVQKEVGQRSCSKAPDMNLLAASVQFYANPQIIDYVSKKSFWPEPKVDGVIIKITISGQKKSVDEKLFFKIIKAGFSQPRKQILNNLSHGLKLNKKIAADWLLKNKIKPEQRAETLDVENWIKLTSTY